jgi:hypothetical protein
MTLDLSDYIDRLKAIEQRFNKSNDPTERYACIQAINHIAEKELPFHDWVEEQYLEAMLRTHGANTKVKK